MLFNAAYKSMPYIYIILGLLFAFMVELDVMIVSLFLILSVALLIIWIRFSSMIEAEKIERTSSRHHDGVMERSPDNFVHRGSGNRRIVSPSHSFPFFDRMGITVAQDRRGAERREVMNEVNL